MLSDTHNTMWYTAGRGQHHNPLLTVRLGRDAVRYTQTPRGTQLAEDNTITLFSLSGWAGMLSDTHDTMWYTADRGQHHNPLLTVRLGRDAVRYTQHHIWYTAGRGQHHNPLLTVRLGRDAVRYTRHHIWYTADRGQHHNPLLTVRLGRDVVRYTQHHVVHSWQRTTP